MERHIILTLGRSGSNTLVNLLNQHPEILNTGEVLGDWNKVRRLRDRLGLYRGNTAAYLDALTRRSLLIRGMNTMRSLGRLTAGRPGEIKRLDRVQSLGFKEFATLMTEQGMRNWLGDRPDVKVIGLVRNDPLARLVSWQVMERTGVVASKSQKHFGDQAFEIDPTRIEEMLTTIAGENDLLIEMLGELPDERVRILRYDAFYRDEATRRQMLDDVFQFLGVKPWQPEIRMKKIVAVPPAEMIANRQECAEALKGSRFEGMLDLNPD